MTRTKEHLMLAMAEVLDNADDRLVKELMQATENFKRANPIVVRRSPFIKELIDVILTDHPET